MQLQPLGRCNGANWLYAPLHLLPPSPVQQQSARITLQNETPEHIQQNCDVPFQTFTHWLTQSAWHTQSAVRAPTHSTHNASIGADQPALGSSKQTQILQHPPDLPQPKKRCNVLSFVRHSPNASGAEAKTKAAAACQGAQ